MTYNPYKNRILYEVGLKPDAVGNCKDAILGKSLLNVFKVTPPNKWTNTSILIGYSYAPPYTICSNCSRKGIEFEAHFMMMEKMNITGNYIISDFAKLDYDDHVRKLFSTTKYDIILNGVFVKNYDYTKPFHDYYYMYAPSSNKISNWKYIMNIFHSEVWVALMFTVLCICSTWYIINMLSSGEYHPKYILQKFVAIFILSLDQNWYFQIDYLHKLVLYTIIKVFCFVVFLFWKSEYTHRLTQLIYENDITSMSEAMEKELLVGFPSYRFFLFEENPKIMDYLKTHFINCNHSDYCLEQAAYHRNMVTPRVERYFNFIQHEFLDEYGRSLMKKMKYPLLPIQYVQVLPKGHILTHIISKHLEDLRSHGFISRLMKKYDELSRIQPPLYNSRKKLKIEHIEAPLGLWLLGNLVGLVAFFVEKFIAKKHNQ
ncbi:hypothetical protein WA026_005833 [Henosepilachna vigintioctopunctata]|uniref:Ionotropic receptor n=1 Tax=Henosepilachna vigintioctopunctata TaxID=420089 RepID=A0AAW1U234_9CUCU